MILQQNIVHRDVSIPLPALNIELFISPDFTGRVVLYIEKGRVTCDRRLLDDEHICALDTFIEMARERELRLEEISNVG
ncbi:hypothetical protein KZL06_004374 [Salmonella enterica subsp. enterica serovar Teshie]|uniref:hypothetical protein n=1 Tax=Salmonella enterica TaxID=28901 RepID=UPI000F97142D|nr:hypothetical protein [Salmonella enterica]EAC0474479.1 hypothetical protein [Salmonella enterica subsp. enterica serovar Tornow]EBY3150936.1 hypothetical protein [Salmonella enterica subsp. enterica serovar Teshie]EDS6429204.1 hypothetical protein [Salmonella enterica subsp. enterica]EGI5054368.1 hypothetical protein [Salmonella enterica subsp. enterica serovar Worthington]EBA4960212.1 hypothetical protein [Salmonella enterica]